jgi:hypothetical protein
LPRGTLSLFSARASCDPQPNELGQSLGTGFFHDVSPMELDRARADCELCRGFLIGFAAHQMIEHLVLAIGQLLKEPMRRPGVDGEVFARSNP